MIKQQFNAVVIFLKKDVENIYISMIY